jgi:acyl-CoA thioesterase I
MIIMRRIILTLATLALTACDGVPGAGNVVLDRPATARNAAAPGGIGGAAGTGPAAVGQRAEAGTILFVGTSLTAGYGVGEDVAYPAVIQQKIDSAGLPFQVVNAGISGETSAGGLRRIDWSLQQPIDVLVLELGANDGLRGLDPAAMRSNLDEIMRRTRSRHPDADIVLVGMEAPPNLGADYTTRFRQVFVDLAQEYRAVLVPFLLEGVAGEPTLNIDDGIHPNPRGHRLLAETVWRQLQPVLAARPVPSSD